MQAFTPIGVTVADISVTVIYTVYRAIVIAKLIYSSSAWWGFTTAADRQRLEAVIRKAIRLALCDPDQLSLAELVAAADDDLFFQVVYNDKHVLNCLLPAKTERTYQLRNRRHNRSLLAKVGSITESDVIMRQLYKDVYSRLFIFYLFYFYSTDHYLYWLPFVNL